MTRKIIHIDMDCFFAAVEIRDNPKLKDKPVAIGATSENRGVLCTCNYVARQYGIHSAMPTAQAIRMCHKLILLPVNMQKYKKVSREILEILYTFTDKIETMSLDEAYLDVTSCKQFYGSATLIANVIRKEIKKKHHITASAGISPNKLLSKIASDWNKPDGQFTIAPKDISHFMPKLPIKKLFGVGKVTAQKMGSLGIKTCGQLQEKSLPYLQSYFGNFGTTLYDFCRGIDDRPVETECIRKSLSVEKTYTKDITSPNKCFEKLSTLFYELKRRLANTELLPIQTQFIKIKFHDFTQTTVQCMVNNEVNLEIFNLLFRKGYNRRKTAIRLLGVGVCFTQEEQPQNKQLELF